MKRILAVPFDMRVWETVLWSTACYPHWYVINMLSTCYQHLSVAVLAIHRHVELLDVLHDVIHSERLQCGGCDRSVGK